MAKRYLLLGHEVSKEIYEKYNGEKYPFMGRPVSLDGIHIWATSEEIEEQFPQYAAEAKAIIAGIEKEITKMAIPQKKTFHSFLDELNSIYKEESGKYFKALEDFKIAQTEFDATMADRKAPDYIKMIAKGGFERAKETLKQAKKEAWEGYKTRSADIRARMQEFTTDFYRATPDRIDQSAMQLLNTGILSADEMDHLAAQFRDNPPMMRVIGQYALNKANSISDRDERKWKYYTLGKKLETVAISDNALAGFDTLMDFGQQGLGVDEIKATVRSKHWDKIYDDTRNVYNDFIVQSGNSEE